MPRWMSFEGEVALLEGVFAGILCSLFLRFGTVSTPKKFTVNTTKKSVDLALLAQCSDWSTLLSCYYGLLVYKNSVFVVKKFVFAIYSLASLVFCFLISALLACCFPIDA